MSKFPLTSEESLLELLSFKEEGTSRGYVSVSRGAAGAVARIAASSPAANSNQPVQTM